MITVVFAGWRAGRLHLPRPQVGAPATTSEPVQVLPGRPLASLPVGLLTAADSGTMWINQANPSNGVDALYATTDGGCHWVRKLHFDRGRGAEQIQVGPRDEALVLAGAPCHVLLHTVDGGAHWDTWPLPFGLLQSRLPAGPPG